MDIYSAIVTGDPPSFSLPINPMAIDPICKQESVGKVWSPASIYRYRGYSHNGKQAHAQGT